MPQELLYMCLRSLWSEQRIIPKFSFHTTQYARYRPNVWGSFSEQLLKITMAKRIGFRLIYIPLKDSKIPKWLIWQLVMARGDD
jgi:hypothetical protein